MMKNRVIFFLLVFAVGFALFGTAPVGHSQPVPEGVYAGVQTCAGSQDTLPGCVKCHVTGFEKDGGYVDQELTPALAGVQCEACHGPAANHAANPMNKKNLIARPGETICRECHTKGQDPKFDYANKKGLVHGEN